MLAADMAINGGAATFGDYRRQLIESECGGSRHNHLLDKRREQSKVRWRRGEWLKTVAG
jgi:hypothetical protein